MSYNLKNKIVVMIAMSFAVVMIMSNAGHAEDVAPDEATLDTSFELELDAEDNGGNLFEEETVSDEADTGEASASEDITNASEDVPAAEDENTSQPNADENAEDDFLNQEDSEDSEISPEDAQGEADATENPEAATSNSEDATSDGLFEEPLEQPQDGDSAIPEAEAPKSPFESFGNAILSKVDNDLFTQMSSIEKQNTLLNLELKREELKNKVEALRAARVRAKEEEEIRRRTEKEKLKDQEAERNAMVYAEQVKLKQKEIELEKVRQAKVLNEYMNEMLQMNQDWVMKNAELQGQINTLKNDRMVLIKTFEEQISQIQHDTITLQKKAETTIANHNRIVASLNAQINSLKQTITENEDRIRKIQESNSANPFANVTASISDMDDNAIDMSQEYAIMDITGQGDDIVAKIVNKEGTTFVVHKGSMLKGGEIVTSITDRYVSFDNNGVKSFIYTGGTVLEFEPTVTFNNSDKLPQVTEKSSIKAEVKNVLGNPATNDISQKAPAAGSTNKNSGRTSSRRRSAGSVSFGSGMFVQ